MKAIQNTGVTLVGISYDKIETLKRFTTKRNIEFPLLSDSGSKTIVAYGLLNEQNGGGIPHPQTILVGADGIIKAKLGFEGYRSRHNSEDLQKAVKNLKSK